jgi:hypothetical protein
LLEFGEHRRVIALGAGDVAQPQHGDASDRSAFGFDMPPARGDERKSEPLAAFPERIDGGIHRSSRLRPEPGAERENAPCRFRAADRHDFAEDRGLGIPAAPDHHDLRLGEEQRRHAVGFAFESRDFAARVCVLDRGAGARAQQRDRGEDREDKDAQREGQRGDFLTRERLAECDQPLGKFG